MSQMQSSRPMKPCPAPSTAVPVAMAAISARSWPEVNAVPRPVRTTAPIASSASAAPQRLGDLEVHRGVERVAHLGPVEGDQPDTGRNVLRLDAVHQVLTAETRTPAVRRSLLMPALPAM